MSTQTAEEGTVLVATENKRLSDVPLYIKERQEQLPTPKVKINREKNGYKPRGRKPGGKTDLVNDPDVIAKREKALSRPPRDALPRRIRSSTKPRGAFGLCRCRQRLRALDPRQFLWAMHGIP
jgi:hypothetical protein